MIGVDLSPGMLDRARRRVETNGWRNVELVGADVQALVFPEPSHGVVSTYGLERVPEHDAVIGRAVAVLAPGGRTAVGGLRRPESWPFGVTRAYGDVRPWRSVQAHAAGVEVEESLFGTLYLAVGRTPTP